MRLDSEKRVGALFSSCSSTFLDFAAKHVWLLVIRHKIAYSEVDSAAGIAGCVADDQTRETKTMDIDFVTLSTLTTATLVDEHMLPNGQWYSGRWWSCTPGVS